MSDNYKNGYKQGDNYQNGYHQSGYMQNDNYQNGYTQSGYGTRSSYGQGDTHQNNGIRKAWGNHEKQEQIRQRKGHVDFAMSAGVLGAMGLAATGATQAIGATVASGAGAAGLTSLAALGSLPVAGPLLIGGGAIVGGAVAGVMLGHTLYKGVKALANLKSNASEAYNRPKESESYLPPQSRSKDSEGKFAEVKERGNKVDGYLKDAKKDISEKKDIGTKIKNISNLRGLSTKQKREISNLYGDNIIQNSAKENNGVVNSHNIKKQVVADAKEQGWNKAKTAQMFKGVNKRLEKQKDMQNITKDNKVMDMQKEDFVKKAKTKAVKNVKQQTKQSGNSVKAAANNPNFKPKPQKEQSQAKPQQAQKAQKQSAKSSKRSEKLQNDYFNENRGR